MVQAGMLEPDADIRRNGDGKGFLLAIFMTLIAGGFLPIFSFYSRPSTWVIWTALLTIIFLYSRELPLGILLKPVMPYFLWFICFIIWGLIVSPVPDIAFAIKTAMTTLIIALAMAIITSKLLFLKMFANFMQWLLLCNVLLLALVSYSLKINNYITIANLSGEIPESGLSRFAGFWNNPNEAGYICLVAIILSIWATPLAARIGQLSSLPIIYFTGSRKSMLLFMLVFVLNVVFVQRHNFHRLFVWAMAALMLASFFLLSDNVLRKVRTRVASDSYISRMMDVTESKTTELGGNTRVDLFQEWLQVASNEPWYGYGLGAMGGRVDSYGRVINYHLPIVGSHNTYLGVFIETGAIGFVAFILVLFHYVRAYLMIRCTNEVRWAFLSFLACNIMILVGSHIQLFSFEGKVSYALFFLLPTCPALRRYVVNVHA